MNLAYRVEMESRLLLLFADGLKAQAFTFSQMDYFLKTYLITKQLHDDPRVGNNHTHLLGYRDSILVPAECQTGCPKARH